MKDPCLKIGKDLFIRKSTGEHIYKQSTYPNAVTKIINGQSYFFPEGIKDEELKKFKAKALMPGDPGYKEELKQMLKENAN